MISIFYSYIYTLYSYVPLKPKLVAICICVVTWFCHNIFFQLLLFLEFISFLWYPRKLSFRTIPSPKLKLWNRSVSLVKVSQETHKCQLDFHVWNTSYLLNTMKTMKMNIYLIIHKICLDLHIKTLELLNCWISCEN